MTVLYNKETGQIHSHHPHGYRVLGKAGVVEPPLVELAYSEEPIPEHDPDTERVTTTTQVTKSEYKLIREVVKLTEYEIAFRGWLHPDYALRITAPVQMVFAPEGAAMFAWFQLNSNPVERIGDTVHIYVHSILPEHEELAKSLPVERNPAITPFIKNTNSKEIHDRMNAQAKCNIDKITSAIYLTTAEAKELINTGSGDGCGHCMPELSTT